MLWLFQPSPRQKLNNVQKKTSLPVSPHKTACSLSVSKVCHAFIEFMLTRWECWRKYLQSKPVSPNDCHSMLTPSLLLQAFQLPPSLKGSESEQKREPDADSVKRRSHHQQDRDGGAALHLPHPARRVSCVKPRRSSKKLPLLLTWHAQVGISLFSPVIHCQPFLSSSVHASHTYILMGEFCLQFHHQNDARENQDLLKSHYQVPGQDRISSETTLHGDFPAL